ncbi:MAG: hypothetical protein PHO41_08490 [Eubacteriales bacterium]|nr:hypothetical protein [Eubacteriales bacterium]
MKILIVNGSPKKRGGASNCFSTLLKPMLAGNTVTTLRVHNKADYPAALTALAEADAVVIAAPLYIDAIPTHLVCFLQEAERVCRENNCSFKLYVISNCGFIEGKQNALALSMYAAWCERAGVSWGGGLGVGGGVMLYVMLLLFPLSLLLNTIGLVQTVLQSGAVTAAELWSFAEGPLTTLFLSMGLLVFEAMLSYSIRHGKTVKNRYTRVLIPSFLFLIFADIFMLLGTIVKGGIFRNLFHRVPLSEAVSHVTFSNSAVVPCGEQQAEG